MQRVAFIRYLLFISWVGAAAMPAAGEEAEQPGLATLRAAFARDRFVDYTPSEYSPVGQVRPATADSIRADLQVLHPYFSVLVTYSANAGHGLDQVVPLAAENGFRVVLGVWDVKSVAELATAVELSRTYPKTVIGLIIGNETMLRGGAFEDVEAAIKLVHSALPDMPITTSEPIASYGDESLRALGDFYAPTIHWIYQGGDVANPESAVAWLKNRVQALRAMSHGSKPLMLKEHGLPSAPAPFSETAQRDYWKLATAAFPPSPACSLVLFEAFSLPWKTKTNPSEFGAAEAHWGAWTEQRKPKAIVDILARSAP